jgi:hypothetical protein
VTNNKEKLPRMKQDQSMGKIDPNLFSGVQKRGDGHITANKREAEKE